MKVVSCDPGKTEVSPKMYNACTFEIIDKWDPKQHAKTCDTMFYLSDGTGAYVWNCDEWIFLDFSGYTAPDWNAKANQQGFIKNKPFEKLGEFLVVSKDGVLSVSITPSDIGAYTKDETDEKFAKKTGNVASADKLSTARTISLGSMASGSASFDGSKNVKIDTTIQDGTTSQKGVLQLTESTLSDSKTTAATPSSVKKVQVALDDHEKDFDNPHLVTAGQTGAFTKEESSANVINIITGKKKVQITLTLDLKNKVVGSNIENPNGAYIKLISDSILPPSSDAWVESSQLEYDKQMNVDNNLSSLSTKTNLTVAQAMKPWNVLEEMKRYLGEEFFTNQGLLTVSQQVNYIRKIIVKLSSNVWGFGSDPTGNRLFLKTWRGNYNDQQWLYEANTTSSTVKKITSTIPKTSVYAYIDDVGKVYNIAYAEPSNGTVASGVNIDYQNLEVTFEISMNEYIEYVIAAYHRENPPVLAEEKESGLVVMKNTKVSNQDWNTLTETGVYSVGQGNGPNSPTGTTATWGYLVVYRRAADWIEQSYYSSGAMYRRVMQGDPLTWSSWIKMASQSDLKWSNLSDKPFETIGENLEVVDGKLNASGAPDLSGFVTTETDQIITGTKEFEVGPTVNGEKLMTRTMGFKSYSHRYNHLLTGDMTTYLSEMESVFFRRSNFVEYYGRFNVKTAGAMKGTIVTHPIPLGYRQAALTSGPIWNIPFRVCQFTSPQGNYLAMYEGNNVRIYSDKAGNHYVYGSWYTEDAPPV